MLRHKHKINKKRQKERKKKEKVNKEVLTLKKWGCGEQHRKFVKNIQFPDSVGPYARTQVTILCSRLLVQGTTVPSASEGLKGSEDRAATSQKWRYLLIQFLKTKETGERRQMCPGEL